MLVLGIETSCDETSSAVVGDNKVIHANIVSSQIEYHQPFGGVVPEIAARSHLECLDSIIAKTLETAKIDLGDLDGIAVTAGPGLIGGLIVGLLTGKALAAAAGKALIGINHLEGHALSIRLAEDLDFPYLLLLVSGGHTQLLEVRGVGNYDLLGNTIDDAVGEAFDKVANMLGLGYPGGPAIEKAAKYGDPGFFELPRPLIRRPGFDFSFSGLKTAVMHRLRSVRAEAPNDKEVYNMAASFQAAVGDVLCDRVERALQILSSHNGVPYNLVIAGGVGANAYLCDRLSMLTKTSQKGFFAPPPSLCTDNGAMIAWAGVERLRLGLTDNFALPARARWPLTELMVS